jgi:hypothetical protein
MSGRKIELPDAESHPYQVALHVSGSPQAIRGNLASSRTSAFRADQGLVGDIECAQADLEHLRCHRCWSRDLVQRSDGGIPCISEMQRPTAGLSRRSIEGCGWASTAPAVRRRGP